MTTIEIRSRRDDFHAQIKDHPELWGCGSTELAAIGDLVKTHPNYFTLGSGIAGKFRRMPNEDVGILIKMMPNSFGVKLYYKDKD